MVIPSPKILWFWGTVNMEHFGLKNSWKEIFKRRKGGSLPLGYVPETEETTEWQAAPLTYRLTLIVSPG